MSDTHSTNRQAENRRDDHHSGFDPLARKFSWIENPFLVSRVVKGLIIFCTLLFVIDLFYHRHAYFDFEQSRGFYAISGFFAFTIIVLLASKLRELIKRPEDYYGQASTHGENYPDRDLEIISGMEDTKHGQYARGKSNIAKGEQKTLGEKGR